MLVMRQISLWAFGFDISLITLLETQVHDERVVFQFVALFVPYTDNCIMLWPEIAVAMT